MSRSLVRNRVTVLGMAVAGACSGPAPVTNDPEVGTEMPISTTNFAAAPEPLREPKQPSDEKPIAYTSLKSADCKLLDQNVDEGGYSRHRCPGIRGYAIETSESDLRQGLTVIAPGGRRTEIDLSARVANGAFNALGPTAEWRGKNREAPSALIVRLNVTKPEQAPDTSNLVVVRLGDPTCISSVVPPGPRQNEIARRQAEAEAPACLRT